MGSGKNSNWYKTDVKGLVQTFFNNPMKENSLVNNKKSQQAKRQTIKLNIETF